MRTAMLVLALQTTGLLSPGWAQTPNQPPGRSTLGLAGGSRMYLSDTSERRFVLTAFLRDWFNPTFGCEVELVAGGGRDGTTESTDETGATVSVIDWAGSIGFNLVARTPGRVAVIASAGPGFYVDQRDTQLQRGDDGGEPELLDRAYGFYFGLQASAGIDIALDSDARFSALFALIRYEARSVASPKEHGNWQALVGLRWPLR